MVTEILQMQGIDKAFPGVQALEGVDLTLHAGEVLALVGENGAGKSTLIKVLAGAHAPDRGTMTLNGMAKTFPTPAAARRASIAVIYQEFNLVPTLTVADNIFLGLEKTNGWLRKGQERRQAQALFQRLGVPVDPDARCRDLTVAQQQVVEIAKALASEARILIMDEPSATLTPREVERLFAIIGELKTQGIGIIYISHRLDEVFDIADRVMVLRDGRHVATRSRGALNRDELIELMVGRRLDQEFPPRQTCRGEACLVVNNLCWGNKVRHVSFALHRGEILALTGLVGSGRTETARLLFGAAQPDGGTIELGGRPLYLHQPRDAIRHGICLLTEDRKAQGLVLGLSVRENFALPNLARLARLGVVDRRRERQALERFVQTLRIRLPHTEQLARNLSGGNQQKVVLAKWLQADCDVLIFDEPTRGIDVGAKYDIYLLLNELAAKGKAILMISSELPEVLGMADRILVMHEGRITGEITDGKKATQEQIMKLAVG